jgi:hypothetical protein
MLRGAQHDNRKDRLLRKRARNDDGWSQLFLRSHKNFAGLSMTTLIFVILSLFCEGSTG